MVPASPQQYASSKAIGDRDNSAVTVATAAQSHRCMGKAVSQERPLVRALLSTTHTYAATKQVAIETQIPFTSRSDRTFLLSTHNSGGAIKVKRIKPSWMAGIW